MEYEKNTRNLRSPAPWGSRSSLCTEKLGSTGTQILQQAAFETHQKFYRLRDLIMVETVCWRKVKVNVKVWKISQIAAYYGWNLLLGKVKVWKCEFFSIVAYYGWNFLMGKSESEKLWKIFACSLWFMVYGILWLKPCVGENQISEELLLCPVWSRPFRSQHVMMKTKLCWSLASKRKLVPIEKQNISIDVQQKTFQSLTCDKKYWR